VFHGRTPCGAGLGCPIIGVVSLVSPLASWSQELVASASAIFWLEKCEGMGGGGRCILHALLGLGRLRLMDCSRREEVGV
jgi:hypothetical protein